MTVGDTRKWSSAVRSLSHLADLLPRAAFIAAIVLWVHAALRRVKRSQLRRTAYISSALNSLSHGVVLTDPNNRIVYCNDRYLEIYGLHRSDLPPGMTGKELLALRR